MTDVPAILRADLAAAFPNSPRLVRTFEDLFLALTEAKATADASATADVHGAPVLLTAANGAFASGSVLTQGDGISFTEADGTLTIAAGDTIPVIDGGFPVTFITTAETNLILPTVGQVATILDIGSVVGALTAADIAFTPTGAIGSTNVQAAIAELDTEKLAVTAYTAADVFAKVLTLDGAGSGLDADLLDGQSSAYFLARANHTGSQLAATISDFSTAADARIAAAVGVTVQAYDPQLAAVAGLTPAADQVIYWTGATAAAMTSLTTYGRSLIDDVDAATARATLGLVIGTNVQAWDADLDAIAGLTSAADRLPYFTGSGTAALATFTAAGRALVDDADATAQRATLGLGTAATAATGTSGTTVPLLDGANTWSGANTFNSTFTLGNATGPALTIGTNRSAAAWGNSGLNHRTNPNTLTDTSTAAAGTVAGMVANSYGTPTFAATNAMTATHAATMYIAGAPAAGSNMTLTNAWALRVASGDVSIVDNLVMGGVVKVGANQVVGARKTGWALPTGTISRATFDTATVTTAQLAQRVYGMLTDFYSTAGHGLLGA
jgi:hypothetical protein